MDTQTKAPPKLLPAPLVIARDLAAREGLEPAQYVEVLRSTYFVGLNDAELCAALAICKRYDLDPFLREIHCFKNGDRVQTTVGIDGWLKAARRNGLAGIEAPEIEADENGQPVAATVAVRREDWPQPVRWTAFMREWKKNSPNWNTQPVHMLTLKAMKLALRFAFGISGLDLEDPEELRAPANGAGQTAAPGVRSSRVLPEPVTPRPAAARPAGGTAAPKAQPAGGGGAAAVLAPREAAPPSDPSLRPGEDQAPWDVDDAEDAPPARQDGPGTAPEAANEPEAVAPPETPPAASQAAPSARETMIEAVRGLEGKLTAAGVVVHVSSREELEETSQAELQKRATQLRQSLWNAKKPGGKSKA